MKRPFVRRGVLALAGLCLLPLAAVARAQTTESPRELDPLNKLEPVHRYAVEVMLDSARLAQLPTGPIESKALEGISKQKNGRVIVSAVRDVYRSLIRARSALGPTASPSELTAAANALRVGITTSELSHLASTRSEKPLTVPLVVLSDLVTRGVPRDTASRTIFQLWQRGAADDDFLGLWRGVERDIVSGTDPGVALMNRAREIPTRAPPPTTTPSGARQPDELENQKR